MKIVHRLSGFTLFPTMLLMMLQPSITLANSYFVASTESAFEDVTFTIENDIIDRGLVLDFQGHSGDMLERTAEVNEVDSPYTDARYFNFCSSKLTHAAIAANTENIAICPYVVYAYQLQSSPEKTHVGYRKPMGASGASSEAALADIEALLRSIVDAATTQ